MLLRHCLNKINALRSWSGFAMARRLGFAGLAFFLVKGLLWILIPALALAWSSSGR